MVKVNEAQLGINDYYEKIKNPMDLTTLSENLTKGEYLFKFIEFIIFFIGFYQNLE